MFQVHFQIHISPSRYKLTAMIFIQLVCIQLLLLVVSNQVLAKPFEIMDNPNQRLIPSCGCNYDKTNVEQFLFDENNNDQMENARHLVKLAKRRAQAKANLAGLWGVPTNFA